jgi:hypothetical protein
MHIAMAGKIILGIALAIAGCSVTAGQSSPRHAQAHVATGASGRRWYAPSSLWNTPIRRDPRIASNNASLIAAWSDSVPCRGFPCLDPSGIGYVPAIYYPGRATKKVPVRIDVPHCHAHVVRVPIPAGVQPDPSREGHMAIAAADGTEYDFYGAQYPGGHPKSSRYYARPCSTVHEWTAAKVVTTNWISGNGELRGSGRGSGTPDGAGTILPRDTKRPPGSNWGHAIALSYRNTCSHEMRWCPFVAPATEGDGTGTNRAIDVPEGARFQLDPSINCDTWPSLRYVWQRQMCRTFQVYGAIIADTNTGGMGIYVQWVGSMGGYTYPWQPSYPGFPNDLLSHFRVLAWR